MILLIIFWICWCALHSLLISARVNTWVQQKGGFLHGTHRLAYTLFSVVSLIPLLWYQYTLPQQALFSWSGWWRIPQGILLVYAFVMLYGGQKVYDFGYLVGFRQWNTYRLGLKRPVMPFFCEGVLQYVRHPWYSSGLAILWVVGSVTDADLPARIILSVYLVIGAILEEQKLVQELGALYRSYCEQVPMLIPWRGKVSMTQN